jgi:hypothetical protein
VLQKETCKSKQLCYGMFLGWPDVYRQSRGRRAWQQPRAAVKVHVNLCAARCSRNQHSRHDKRCCEQVAYSAHVMMIEPCECRRRPISISRCHRTIIDERADKIPARGCYPQPAITVQKRSRKHAQGMSRHPSMRSGRRVVVRRWPAAHRGWSCARKSEYLFPKGSCAPDVRDLRDRQC